MDPTLGQVFVSEMIGTATLIILGCGVVATAILSKSKGQGGGWLLITVGWGLAVFGGVSVAYASGAHLNPAVTIGIIVAGKFAYPLWWALIYILGQLIGAILGAVIVWLAFKKHFDAETEQGTILGVFSTGPEIRAYGWNVVTEIVGTFVLVFSVVAFTNGGTPAELGALPVTLIVVAIGSCLGGPTGYAINPARDLGPRIAHAFLPIPNKGGSDWAYSWVPIVGPIIGAVLAGAASYALLPIIPS